MMNHRTDLKILYNTESPLLCHVAINASPFQLPQPPFPNYIYTTNYPLTSIHSLTNLNNQIKSISSSIEFQNPKSPNPTMNLIEQAQLYMAEKLGTFPKPEATVNDVDLKGCGLDGLTFLAKISVTNPYSVSIPIGEIAYTVKSHDRTIASGSIPDPGSLKADDNTAMEVTVKVPHGAVLSLVRDIGGDWDIDYVLELRLIIDLPVVGNITIPMAYEGVMKLPTFSDFFTGGKSEPAADKKDGDDEEEK